MMTHALTIYNIVAYTVSYNIHTSVAHDECMIRSIFNIDANDLYFRLFLVDILPLSPKLPTICAIQINGTHVAPSCFEAAFWLKRSRVHIFCSPTKISVGFKKTMAMSQTRRLRGALFLALCVFSLWSLGCRSGARAGLKQAG